MSRAAMSRAATTAPCSERVRATAAPLPRAAPVTIATRPPIPLALLVFAAAALVVSATAAVAVLGFLAPSRDRARRRGRGGRAEDDAFGVVSVQPGPGGGGGRAAPGGVAHPLRRTVGQVVVGGVVAHHRGELGQPRHPHPFVAPQRPRYLARPPPAQAGGQGGGAPDAL